MQLKHIQNIVFILQNNDHTSAWNNNNFIVYGLVENSFKTIDYPDSYYTVTDTVADAYDEEYEDAPIEIMEEGELC